MLDFICVGAQKSGTTWLDANLKSHPEIWTPFIKEVHYFDVIHLDYEEDFQQKVYEKKISSLSSKPGFRDKNNYYGRVLNKDFSFTDEWYEYIFSAAPAGKKRGETTPYYSSLPAEGIAHVKRLAPDVKIIYLIRDPIERALSSLKMSLSNNPEISQVEFCNSNSFISRGDYRANVTRWDSFFSDSNILFIPYGKIRSNPSGLLHILEHFLDISHYEGYPHVSERIFRTREHNIEEEAVQVIHKNAAVQYDFLEKRFGIDFLRETK